MATLKPELLDLFAQTHLAALVTLKRDGRPQISNISYWYDERNHALEVSITDGRAKTANMRRDPRVSLQVSASDGWKYAVAEGEAELSPVAADPNDATVEALVNLFRNIQGEHSDWNEYRLAMVADKRLVLRVPITHVYGMA
ncbi:MAG: PPOX class F420-dependent oxidoreductase [Antricoccus sp.]